MEKDHIKKPINENPMNSSFQNCYRELILTGKSPLLIHETLNWEFLTWSLGDWLNIFHDNLLNFRCGKRRCQKFPVWEGQCEIKPTTFETFIKFCDDEKSTDEEWRYFDYKHIGQFFENSKKVFKSLSWGPVGFPEKDAESSTLWIGSSGAHTPCHIDTYGCNIVVQVYGRKRWILFPFSEMNNLQPTRIPYEESSIYSNINFSCPKNLKRKNFKNCYTIDLNPGDILFVPPKWWHYVENLDTAISINTWIPHAEDNSWRLREGLVRYFVSSILSVVPDGAKKEILNPNENNLENGSTQLRILNFCKEKEKSKSEREGHSVFQDCQLLDTLDEHSHNHKYTLISKSSDFVMQETEKHKYSCTLSETDDDVPQSSDIIKELIAVIDAFCHPDIITEVQNKFLNG